MNNKGIMNIQKGNIIYRVFIIAVTVIFLFFVFMTIKNKSSDYNIDYQAVLDYGEDSYIIKVDNAAYLKDKKQLSFIILSKASGVEEPTSSKPYISECIIYYSKGSKEVDVKKIKSETKSDAVQLFTVNDVKENISYVYLLISIKYKDYTDPDTVDEFGQLKKGEKHKGLEETEMVQIDKSDIKVMENIDYQKNVKEAVKQSNEFFNEEKETEITSSQTTTGTSTTTVNTTITTTVTTKRKPKKTKTSTTTIQQTEPKPEPDDTEYNEPTTTEVPVTQPPQTQPQTKPPVTTTTKPKTQITTKAKPKIIKVTDIKLNKQSITLKVGKSYALIAKIIPANAKNKKIKWESFSSDVATVNSKGVVTAHCSGMTIITVTTVDGEYTAECMVNVVEAD